MARANGDSILHHFKKGAHVEISSDDDGFRGSWYEGVVIRPPRGGAKRGPNKVLVEYKTLTEDEAGTRPLREELEVVQLRPPQPREERGSFEFGDDVDACYSDGWWEGTITQVLEEEEEEEEGGKKKKKKKKYVVFFSGTKEQITFAADELRVHREWEYGKWVPPLEVPDEDMPDAPMEDKEPAEGEATNEEIERKYFPGDHVEVSSNEEGFEGAWFTATILKKLKNGKYLVEYKTLKNDDDTFLREEAENLFIRPCPPDLELVDRFEVNEEVDAFYNDGWWTGAISKVHKIDKYSVYFSNTHEEIKFKHSDLRVHQKWVNGDWTTTKDLKL